MSLVVAFDDIKPDQFVRLKSEPGQPAATQVRYFKATGDTPNAPSAFLARYEPGMGSSAHFHMVDQFQIIVEGKGMFGRHSVSPLCVHFSRAYTPYGPLHADQETGWTFMTLRARYDAGAHRVLEELKQIPDRRPWQISRKVAFPAQDTDVSLQEIDGIKDDQGLFAYSLTMAPRSRTIVPDPSRGDGQYIIVVKGSLVHDRKESKAQTVIFLKPEEAAFQLEAGAQGLQALVLNFPRVGPRAAAARAPSAAAGLKKWQCILCAFAYDEAAGMPDDGIPAGTRWEDVPETWSCPDCSASKSDFHMVEV